MRATSDSQRICESKALILGGGGVAGLAWELGVLAGLRDRGLEFEDAEAVIGTSAGAFAASVLAHGALEDRFAEQLTSKGTEIPAVLSPALLESYRVAYAGGRTGSDIGRRFGSLAAAASTVSTGERMKVVQQRLGFEGWPTGPLQITAMDAATGIVHVIERTSGLTLTEAVAASGAVPGIWPVVDAAGHKWIDGGVLSATNVHLTATYDTAIVIAPMTNNMSGSTVFEEIQRPDIADRVLLISPDAQALSAIGSNFFDPAKRASAAKSGREQGQAEAAKAVNFWSAPGANAPARLESARA